MAITMKQTHLNYFLDVDTSIIRLEVLSDVSLYLAVDYEKSSSAELSVTMDVSFTTQGQKEYYSVIQSYAPAQKLKFTTTDSGRFLVPLPTPSKAKFIRLNFLDGNNPNMDNIIVGLYADDALVTKSR